MTSVAMAQSNYITEGRRMTTTMTSEATATTTNTNTNNNNAGGISPSESSMTTSAYMVRVMAMNSSYDIPVTPHTRVSSVLREVAELAISFEQSIALGDVHAALCHGDIVLPVDGPIGLLPQNAVLRLLTNFDPGFDTIDEHLTVTLMSYHTVQQQQQQMQQRLQRQASMRTTAASLHGMRRVGSRSGLVTVPETSLILSPYDASLTPNSMLYPHAVVLAPHGKAQPYVIGQPATHYAGRSLVMSSPPVTAAQYVAATPMPIVNGILATGTNTAVPHVAGTPWAMAEGSAGGAVYRVPIRSADELLLPADLAERQRRGTTTTLTAYQSAPRSKSAQQQQDRFAPTTPTKSSPFVPLDPNGIRPKNRASGTSFRSIISLVSRPFSLGRRSSSSPQTGSVHTNLTEEERRENSSPQSVHAEQTPLPLKKESNGQPQTNYPIESNNNHRHQQQQQQRLSSQEDVEVEDREGSFEHEPRSFTRPPVDRRATLDEMHDAGSGPADGTLLSPHSAPAVDTTNTKVEDYSSLHEDKENNNNDGAEVHDAPMPVRRVSKSMTDTSQSHTLPSDHVISFNTTTLPSLPKTGTLAEEEEEEDNVGELNENSQQQALVKKEKRKASTTVNSTPTSPEGAAVVKAAVRRRRSSPNAPATIAAASSSSHTSTASRTRITSVTRRMSEGGDPNNNNNNHAAVGSAMAAVANKRQQQHQKEHHTPHTPTPLPILHSIEISHPRKRGHISTTTTTTKASEAASKASAVRESVRGAAYMTVRDNSKTPTEKALAHDDKKEKTEEDELEEEERVRTPKPAHRKNSSATRLRHSKDVSPTLEEQIVNKEEKEKEVLVSAKRRASQERAGSKERSLLNGGGAIRERSHPLPSLPQLSPKSLKEVHGSVKESETRRISITGTAPHSSSRSTPSLKPLPSPTEAAADTKKETTSKKASPHAATNETAAEEQVMSSTGRRPRRTPRSPQATTITAIGGDAGTAANYTGTSPADDYALPFTPSPTPHTLVNPNTDTVTPAPVTANIAHTALPNKTTVKKSKGSGATKESSEEKAAAAAEKKESLSPNKRPTGEETDKDNETPASPPQPKSILMISSLPRYTHQITFNTRGGRRKSSQLSSPSSALHTPNSANGHARGSTTSAKHASSSSSVERDSAHYIVESFDTEGKEFIRITLRDPIDPTIFHFSVPVDRHCPVGALRSWLTDEIAARAREDGRPVPAFMDVKRYALYCGDTRLVDDSRLTFEDATRGKHDCIFSIRLLH